MCGLAGLAGCGDRSVLQRMTDIQRHRGPDDGGLWETRLSDGSWWGLGSRRLSIRDLSASGHMPMSDASGRVTIAYNGEVYNADALRAELEAKGERFRSGTDTEVVLALYMRGGPDFVERLNGIFAFAVADLRGKPRLMLARDPFGVKPLYYARRGDGLAFASEAKALLELDGLDFAVDPAELVRSLTFLWVPEPRTMWRGVDKLPAGHYGLWDGGAWNVKRYWEPTCPPAGWRTAKSADALAEEVRDRFQATVKSQLVSDVPIGAFLSAGLDSSSIVAAMRRVSSGKLRTYTITFPEGARVGENNLDDPAVAARLAKSLGAEHTEIVVEPDVADLLPKLVWHMDDPTADPAIIMSYLVCREARKSSTVLLSGVGGDEVFGGYRKYQAALAARHYRRLPGFLRRGLIEPALSALPVMEGTRFKGLARMARKFASGASLGFVEQFIRNGTYLDGGDLERVMAAYPEGDPARAHRAAFASVDGAHDLDRMMYADQKLFMPSLNLNYTDKTSMANSVEVRVPFLDHEFAQWAAWNVPPDMKIRGGTRKWILRRAMEGILPAEVLRQPKASFGAPVGKWLAGPLREMTDDLLSESRLKRRGWLKPEAVASMVREHRAGTADRGMQIWQFLTLELWAQAFQDRTPSSEGTFSGG